MQQRDAIVLSLAARAVHAASLAAAEAAVEAAKMESRGPTQQTERGLEPMPPHMLGGGGGGGGPSSPAAEPDAAVVDGMSEEEHQAMMVVHARAIAAEERADKLKAEVKTLTAQLQESILKQMDMAANGAGAASVKRSTSFARAPAAASPATPSARSSFFSSPFSRGR